MLGELCRRVRVSGDLADIKRTGNYCALINRASAPVRCCSSASVFWASSIHAANASRRCRQSGGLRSRVQVPAVDPKATVTNVCRPAAIPSAGFGLGAAEIRLSEIFPPVVSNGESRVRRHKGALGFFGPAPRARGLRIVLPTPACDSRLPLSLRRLSSQR